MAVEKTLLDYTNSFSSNDYQEHDKKKQIAILETNMEKE